MLVWAVDCCAWLVSDVVVPRYRGDLVLIVWHVSC